MLLSGEPALRREEMDEIDLAMLQQLRAPGLLPADWVEMDGQLTFRYALEGRRMLGHRLRLQPLAMQDYYALLLGVADILDACKPNLLREEAVLLNEDYLFAGDEWSDLRAAYVPLKAAGVGRRPCESVQLLAVRWVARVSHVDGAGLRHVLQLLEDGVSWQELRTQLLRLIGGEGAAIFKPGMPVQATPGASGLLLPDRHQPYQTEAEAEQPSAVSSGGGRWPIGGLRARLGDTGEQEGSTASDDSGWLDEPPAFPDGTAAGDRGGGRTKAIACAAAAVLTAVIWRTVPGGQPSGDKLLMAAGLTVLVACGLLLVWRRLGESRSPVAPDVSEGSEKDAPGSGQAIVPGGWRGNWGEPDGCAEEGGDRPMHQAERRSAVRSGGDDTVLLAAKSGDDEPHIAPFRLTREWRGQAVRLELPEGTSVVGRSADAADLPDPADGVSRAHAEFMRTGFALQVRDLGSRNGSLLNGEPMVPYKYYELNEGDRIQLAGPSGPVYRRAVSGSH